MGKSFEGYLKKFLKVTLGGITRKDYRGFFRKITGKSPLIQFLDHFSESIPGAIYGCISEGFPVGIPEETPLKAVVKIKKILLVYS